MKEFTRFIVEVSLIPTGESDHIAIDDKLSLLKPKYDYRTAYQNMQNNWNMAFTKAEEEFSNNITIAKINSKLSIWQKIKSVRLHYEGISWRKG